MIKTVLAEIIKLGPPSQLGLPEVSIDEGAKGVVNLVFLVIAVLSVLWLLLFGAIPYIFSGGESSTVKKAKDAIVYSVIGIVVSLVSFAIVNFVTSKVH